VSPEVRDVREASFTSKPKKSGLSSALWTPDANAESGPPAGPWEDVESAASEAVLAFFRYGESVGADGADIDPKNSKEAERSGYVNVSYGSVGQATARRGLTTNVGKVKWRCRAAREVFRLRSACSLVGGM
jgi:hypothetical protein